jgi:CNT family concentrative nucleoside transporter
MISAGLLGLFVFLGLAWLLSEDRRRFPWRTVLAGLALQLLFACLILRTDPGHAFFSGLDHAFRVLLGFAEQGTAMVFGPLADPALLRERLGKGHSFIFVITVTGTMVLVSALSAMLFHYGILQRIVRSIAWVMRRSMGTSGTESLAAAANIFMGQAEAPLVVRPWLSSMTRSELLSLMVGGMATIAGGVLAAYIGFGIPAGHLLTASVMSAPAALLMAKILLPETGRRAIDPTAPADSADAPVNGLDALCRGAHEGLVLAGRVMAVLIALVACVALANHLLSLLLAQIGIVEATPLQSAFGWLNAPFAWLMGVPWHDCRAVGALLGERIVLNELVAYLHLSGQMQQAGTLEPRSAVIATYALCGFANFASVAIQVGCLGALVPERRGELARLGLRAMIGGLLACYLTACIAGLLTP